MVLVNERGQVVRLGAQLMTPGGEGAIYEVLSDSSLVAKVYHSRRMRRRRRSSNTSAGPEIPL